MAKSKDGADGVPTNRTLAAFAGPSLPFAALGLPLVVNLPPFYAESVGINVGVVGIIFMVVRMFDIPIDPFLGGLMDRTKTRWGRFRPWMVGCVPLLILAVFLVFMPLGPAAPILALASKVAPGWGKEVFMTLSLVLIYVGFSIAALAQTSWASTLSNDYDQRSRIYGWWQAGNVVGILVVLALPVVLSMNGGTQAQGVEAMGWLIIVLLPISVGIAVWQVPEPPPTVECHATIADYFAFFKLTAVRRLMLTDLLLGLAPGITGALALFYFKSAKGMTETQAGIMIFLYFAAGFVGAPLWAWTATKLGKHRALALAGLFYAAAYIGVWLAPAGSFPLLALSMVGVGVPFSATPVLLRAMMADVGDEERLKSGEDRTGMLYALLTATNKVGYAIAVGITFVGLELAGFNEKAGSGNSQQALLVLTVLFVALPMTLLLIGSWIIRGFPIDQARQQANRAALEAKEAAAQ